MNAVNDPDGQGQAQDPELTGRQLAEVLDLADQVAGRITDGHVERRMYEVFDRLAREDLAAELSAKTSGLADEQDSDSIPRDIIPAGTFHGGAGSGG
jgi:hypothetical protein